MAGNPHLPGQETPRLHSLGSAVAAVTSAGTTKTLPLAVAQRGQTSSLSPCLTQNTAARRTRVVLMKQLVEQTKAAQNLPLVGMVEVRFPLVGMAETRPPLVSTPEIQLHPVGTPETRLPPVSIQETRLPLADMPEMPLPLVDMAETRLPVLSMVEKPLLPPTGTVLTVNTKLIPLTKQTDMVQTPPAVMGQKQRVVQEAGTILQ